MKEDIIRMAREAGWDAHHAEFDTRIQAFAALVAAAAKAEENEELRTALVRTMNLYNTAAIHRDRLFEKLIEQKLKEKNNG